MGIGRTIFYTSGLVSIGGYILIHKELTQLYPDVPLYELPKTSRIRSILQPNDKSKHIPYCDTFKITIKTPKNVNEITKYFLTSPLLTTFLKSEYNPVPTSDALQGKITSQVIKKNNYESTLIDWSFKSQSLVSWFEKLASYGYPWRLMNGGFHEIYVQKLKDNGNNEDLYEVYFSSAHEYNNLRDGKFIPRWTQSLHKDYARIVLHLRFSQYSI